LSKIDSLKDFLFIITRNEVISGLRKKGPQYPVGEYLENALEEEYMLPGHILAQADATDPATGRDSAPSSAETSLPAQPGRRAAA
jgi:DNA-directed RNA polymerase specialized sigma24 family protein